MTKHSYNFLTTQTILVALCSLIPLFSVKPTYDHDDYNYEKLIKLDLNQFTQKIAQKIKLIHLNAPYQLPKKIKYAYLNITSDSEKMKHLLGKKDKFKTHIDSGTQKATEFIPTTWGEMSEKNIDKGIEAAQQENNIKGKNVNQNLMHNLNLLYPYVLLKIIPKNERDNLNKFEEAINGKISEPQSVSTDQSFKHFIQKDVRAKKDEIVKEEYEIVKKELFLKDSKLNNQYNIVLDKKRFTDKIDLELVKKYITAYRNFLIISNVDDSFFKKIDVFLANNQNNPRDFSDIQDIDEYKIKDNNELKNIIKDHASNFKKEKQLFIKHIVEFFKKRKNLNDSIICTKVNSIYKRLFIPDVTNKKSQNINLKQIAKALIQWIDQPEQNIHIDKEFVPLKEKISQLKDKLTSRDNDLNNEKKYRTETDYKELSDKLEKMKTNQSNQLEEVAKGLLTFIKSNEKSKILSAEFSTLLQEISNLKNQKATASNDNEIQKANNIIKNLKIDFTNLANDLKNPAKYRTATDYKKLSNELEKMKTNQSNQLKEVAKDLLAFIKSNKKSKTLSGEFNTLLQEISNLKNQTTTSNDNELKNTQNKLQQAEITIAKVKNEFRDLANDLKNPAKYRTATDYNKISDDLEKMKKNQNNELVSNKWRIGLIVVGTFFALQAIMLVYLTTTKAGKKLLASLLNQP